MFNKLIISAAGSGKTTKLISEALAIENENVLLTTYTEANAAEIKQKIFSEVGFLPANINVSTWFSLLIRHGVKPYQSYLFDFRLKGMILVSSQSGVRYYNERGMPVVYSEENDFIKHYFSNSGNVYSDKLSKLVIRLNKASEGKVLKRLTSIYPNIFIDECQDLAGFDLEIIKLIARSTAKLLLACDPRQVTYLTHNPKKHKKYRNGLLKDFVEEQCKSQKFEVDEISLSKSHRCNKSICNYSNQLYPDVKPSESCQLNKTEHEGIFFVTPDRIDDYLNQFSPVQLRWNIISKGVRADKEVYNFGQSKGLSFDRVLIFPTEDMEEWVKNPNSELKNSTRAKLYVAITRARYSVAIVIDKFDDNLPEYLNWY